MMRRPRFGAFMAAVALAATAAGMALTPARATAARTDAAQIAARATQLADQATARWIALQDAQGRFPDPRAGYGSDYGTPMLGLAIVRRGVAAGDRGRVAAGLRAIAQPVATPTGGSFELLALSRAYRYGASVLAPSPRFRDLWAQHEPELRAHLAGHGPVAATDNAKGCITDPGCYNNLKLVTALATSELAATGITPSAPGALLADTSRTARLRSLLATGVPKVTGGRVARSGSAPVRGGGILSDPPNNPLAYHALSVATFGELLGSAAPRAATRAFGRAARGLLALAAPDGDLSYYGRGQGQVWVPAAVTEAAAVAAHRTRSRTERRRLLAIAAAALERMAAHHPAGRAGMPLVPGALTAEALALRRTDGYASARTYNGLAVGMLDRAAALLTSLPPVTTARSGRAPEPETATTVPSRRAGVVVSPTQGGIVTLTRGPLWVALAARTGPWDDARYGSGLLAIQHRAKGRGWGPVIAAAPYGQTPVPLIAVRDGRRLRVPHATSIRPRKHGATLTGRWSAQGVRGWDPGTRWTWRLLGDSKTLEVAFTARRSLRVVTGALAGDSDRVSRRTSTTTIERRDPAGHGIYRTSYRLTAGGRVPRRVRRSTIATGASAYDERLRHARTEFSVRRGQRVTLRISVTAVSGAPRR